MNPTSQELDNIKLCVVTLSKPVVSTVEPSKGVRWLLFGKILLCFTLLICASSFAQKKGKNLVPNPSFEIHKNKSAVIKNANPWKGVGTVDYYLKPEKKTHQNIKVRVPESHMLAYVFNATIKSICMLNY